MKSDAIICDRKARPCFGTRTLRPSSLIFIRSNLLKMRNYEHMEQFFQVSSRRMTDAVTGLPTNKLLIYCKLIALSDGDACIIIHLCWFLALAVNEKLNFKVGSLAKHNVWRMIGLGSWTIFVFKTSVYRTRNSRCFCAVCVATWQAIAVCYAMPLGSKHRNTAATTIPFLEKL